VGLCPPVYALEDLPLVNTETLSLGGMDSLMISYGHGELILRESESEDLVIREYMSRGKPRYFARISRAGGTLRIREGRRPWLFWNWKTRAEIFLPRSFRGDLRIANASGPLSADTDLLGYRTVDMTVSSGTVFLRKVSGETVSIHVSSGELDLRALGGNSFVSLSSGKLRVGGMEGGEHRIKVSSGSLRIGDLEGRTDLELSSGTITVDRARGGMDAQVSSGALELEDFSGPGSFRVNSGNVRMEMKELREDLRFRLSSGAITLGIPLAVPFTLDAQTHSGSVQVDEGGLETLKISGDSSFLRPLGTGAERSIFARVSSGKLVINRR
jgi:hypothetical protein